MDAKRIPGKPGRSKRERVEKAHGTLLGHRDPILCAQGRLERVVYLNEVLDILDSPDEAPEPDMIHVTMSVDEAGMLKACLLRYSGRFQAVADKTFKVLHDLDISTTDEGG